MLMWTALGGESREGKGFSSPNFSPTGLHISSRVRLKVKEVEHKWQLEFGAKLIPGSSVLPRGTSVGYGKGEVIQGSGPGCAACFLE